MREERIEKEGASPEAPCGSGEGRGLLALVDEPPRTALAAALSTGCVTATALLLPSTLVGIAAQGMSEGLAICLSCIAAGLAGGLLQQLWFNPNVLRLRLAYPARIAWFGCTYLAALAGCALLGGWLPAGEPGAWVAFVAMYLAILGVLTLLFTRRYRRELDEYAVRLAAYRAARGDGRRKDG